MNRQIRSREETTKEFISIHAPLHVGSMSKFEKVSSKRKKCDFEPDVDEQTLSFGTTKSSSSNEASSEQERVSDAAGNDPNPSPKISAPYFFYKDHSTAKDPDPSIPITKPGHIPNFPAKIYDILTNQPDLTHIVSWLPHGRSWKVHKRRDFVNKVIPLYFEHKTYSSFIRQANGWGFRRIISSAAPDRDSYYHELFLRGKPFLLKQMKRPAVATKPQVDEKKEPDLYRISQEHPLPNPPKGQSKRSGSLHCDPLITLQRPRNSSSAMLTLPSVLWTMQPNDPTRDSSTQRIGLLTSQPIESERTTTRESLSASESQCNFDEFTTEGLGCDACSMGELDISNESFWL